MERQQQHTLVNKKTGELAFKLHRLNQWSQYDHIQRLNYYSLIWITKGEGSVVVDTDSIKYKSGMLFTLEPYQPFMFKPHQETEAVIINFHSDFFCIYKHQKEVSCDGVLFNNAFGFPYVWVDDKSELELNWILKNMEQEIVENQFASEESIFTYLKLYLINCSRLKGKGEEEIATSEEHRTIIKLKDLLDKHYNTLHSPKDYAELLFMSAKTLSKIVKDTYGKTLSTLITDRVIIEAKRELYLTGKTIKEIGFSLGYEDEYYFSRFFKNKTGISPKNYRTTVGENKLAE